MFHGLILATDLALISGAYLAASAPFDWALIENEGWLVGLRSIVVELVVLATAWLVLSSRSGVYHSRRTDCCWRELEVLSESWLCSVAIAALAGVALDGVTAFSPLWLLLGGLVVLFLARACVRFLLRQLRVSGHNFRTVLIVGEGETPPEITRTVRSNPHYGVKIDGWASFGDAPSLQMDGVDYVGTIDSLQRRLACNPVDYVIVCPPRHARFAEIERVFAICGEAGIECHYSPRFLSSSNPQPVLTWYGDLPTFAFRYDRQPAWKHAFKRAIDLAGAMVAVALLSPLLLAISIAIKLDGGGPILFRQTRVGRRGREFSCFKFRTMCVDAESRRAALLEQNEQDGPVFKIRNDPRITRVGALLRKYSLDELPQFFNVLRGEMSLVGPRPPIPAEVDEYHWWQRRRISVRPGITCIWQVWGRNNVSFEQWMEMDLYYIDHWTLRMDMKLMLRTFGAVLRGTGS